MKPRPRSSVLDISPYVPGGSALPGVRRVVKLASNESALGPSPHALEAFAAASARLHLYPDSQCRSLRRALSRRYGLRCEGLVCGGGSEYLIDLLTRVYAGPGDEVLFSELTFPLYRIAAQGAGAVPVEAPHTDFRADVDALLAHVSPRTKIVFLANPNNPTGAWLGRTEVERLRAGLPDHVLLVIDAAYAEYVTDTDYTPGADLVDRAPGNVVMTRTFSKIHALANLRVGWAYCPDHVADALLRLRLPFCVSTPAAEAAEAALADEAHAARSRAHTQHWRPRLEAALAQAGMEVTPGAANFTFFRVPPSLGGLSAFDAHLRARGIIARPIASAGAMRVTIGRDADNEAFLDAVAEFVHLPAAANG